MGMPDVKQLVSTAARPSRKAASPGLPANREHDTLTRNQMWDPEGGYRMKCLSTFFAIMLLTCTVAAQSEVHAQQRHAAPAKVNTKLDAEIVAVYEGWAKAFREHDLNGIMSFYAPNVVAYDIGAPLEFVGFEKYRADYQDFLAQFDGPIDVEYRDLRVVAGKDVAFVHALERMTGVTKNGQKMDIWFRTSSGLQKINGKWLIVHDHLSVPVDLDSGKAALNLQP